MRNGTVGLKNDKKGDGLDRRLFASLALLTTILTGSFNSFLVEKILRIMKGVEEILLKWDGVCVQLGGIMGQKIEKKVGRDL